MATKQHLGICENAGGASTHCNGVSPRNPSKTACGRGVQPQESIAIVGIGCRFPGNVSSPSGLWDLLTNPVDLSAPIPPMRFSKEAFYHPEGGHHGSTNSRRSYFLNDDEVKMFDAPFFNISPKEAESMDPQHRLLLEVVYEGLEDAGIPLSESSGTQTAAYVGLMTADWQDLQLRDIDGAPRYLVTGGARSIASNRLSYFFNWHGPSETIDTACSSSLVAVHHAVQALRSGEASMAVAAGSNLLLAPDMYVMTSNLNMLSPTGKCHMWSSDADGYARGEGVACVILKTLSAALAAGDHVYAVVRETGVNQDGRTTGITMPSSTAQTRLIRETYAKAGLDLSRKEDRCQFFEAHGTGTPAGDPLEAQAIWDAFFPSEDQVSTVAHDQLHVGSVKTVMGHLEGCAGLAGLIKATMAMRNGIIPANLHLRTPNPKIAPLLGPGKLTVPTMATTWPDTNVNGSPATRRASVNSFGFGGTNAHVILESFKLSEDGAEPGMLSASPKKTTGSRSSPAVTIVLSATQESSLAALVAGYADFIEKRPDIDLAHLAWTTQRRRTKFAQGISFTGRTPAALVRQMRTAVKAFEDGGQMGVLAPPVESGTTTGILGVFTGQGAQWASMGAKLIEYCPVFARSITTMEDILTNTMKSEAEVEGAPVWSLVAELKAPTGQSRIGEAEFAQPLSTAVQIALIDVLRAVGVEFAAVVGHSSGELAAAYAAGCISSADAILMAYYRGRYSKLGRSPRADSGSRHGKGAMLAASLSWDEAQKLCSDENLGFCDRVCVAANNSPNSVTLSGDVDKIRDMQSLLQDRNVPCQMLRVDKAYHSPHMQVSADAYREALSRCRLEGHQTSLKGSRCVWVSSVHTEWPPITSEAMPESVQSGQYWVENMLAPVRFRDALEKLPCLESITVGVEVGPHPALRRQVTDTLSSLGHQITYRGTLGRGLDDNESFGGLLGFLWQYGVGVSFDPINNDVESKTTQGLDTKPSISRTPLPGLPSMPWQHNRTYWRESSKLAQLIRRGTANELIGHCIERGLSYGGSTRNDKDANLNSCDNYVKLGEWRWRQILRVNELPWLRGHKVQGQVVFPAAGYCVMAMEAAKQLAMSLGNDDQPRLELEVVELRDVEIGRAVMFTENGSDGVEILVKLHDIQVRTRDSHVNGDRSNATDTQPLLTFDAGFAIQAQLPAVGEPGRANEPYLACFGRISGTASSGSTEQADLASMPPYISEAIHLHQTSVPFTYEAYSKVGLEYSAPFRVDTLHRCLGRARSTVRHDHVRTYQSQNNEEVQIPPAMQSCFPVAALDNAFQTSLAAYAAPGDGRLLAPYLPRTIGRLRVHLGAYQAVVKEETELLFEATIRGIPEIEQPQSSDGSKSASWVACVEGVVAVPGTPSREKEDMQVSLEQEHLMIFQVEDLKCVNLVPSEGPYGEGIFCEEIWAPDPDDALRDFEIEPDGPGDVKGLEMVEKLAHYYMCHVYSNFSKEEAFAEKTPWFIRRFWQWLQHRLHKGNETTSKPFENPWAKDPARIEDLMQRIDSIKDRVEVKILHAVAENILRVMRQEEGPTILEVLFQNDMLARLYVEPVMYARANRYLGRIAKTISHRFPRCDILEIGAGTGGATQAMMAGIEGAYRSYTFTDISAGFFVQAKTKFAKEVESMVFKTLDVEKDVEEQGFSPATYDIVVASNVLHATKDIENSLKNARKLLRPGGYLLLLEVTAVDKVLVPFLMGAVPGWWLYEDRWRSGTFSPLLSTKNWDHVLRETGFDTGTEFAFHDMEVADDHLSSLMVARAGDDEWSAFRECKTSPTTKFRTDNLIVVVGEVGKDKTGPVGGRLGNELEMALSQLSNTTLYDVPLKISVLNGLESAAASDLLESSMVLVLSDLQQPVLEDPKPSEWDAVKTVFTKTAHNIIWVTRGRMRGREPSQSMIVGMGRCARYENPSLKIQFVDIDDETSPLAVQALAKIVWQARVLAPSNRDVPEVKTSWLRSVENEVAIENGRLMLPRLLPVNLANERYLARRGGLVPDDEDDSEGQAGAKPRESSRHGLEDKTVSMNPRADSATYDTWSLGQISPPLSPDEGCDSKFNFDLQLRLSCTNGLRLNGGNESPLYLSLAASSQTLGQGKPAHALVMSALLPDAPSVTGNGFKAFSLLAVRNDIWNVSNAEAAFLSVIVEVLAANLLVRAASEDGALATAVMVFEPSPAFESAVLQFARKQGKKAYVVTARRAQAGLHPSAVYIHPLNTAQKTKSLLGDHTGLYANWPCFRSSESQKPTHWNDIGFDLSKKWRRVSEQEIMVPSTHTAGYGTADSPFTAHLAELVESSAILAASLLHEQLPVLKDGFTSPMLNFPVKFQGSKMKLSQPGLIDWSADTDSASIQLGSNSRLLPSPKRLFSPDKTYFFAGITSDLGLSVAKWMVINGARSIALASRAPKIPATWLNEMEELSAGTAKVRAFTMDATNQASVQRVCDEIGQSMAPVAGVVYGAMVLKDALLESMPFETLKTTMDPKVKGSYNVEQYFHKVPLDFFIFMGSMSAIVGIRGQSNYCAGNMYGRSLVTARRARGLAASTVDLSTVFGVGYFANAGAASLQTVNANLRGFNTLAIGEADVLDAFHEAILRGPPGASSTGDVIVGLGSETAVPADHPAAWHDDPRFGHFTERASQSNKSGRSGGGSGAGGATDRSKNVREKLAKTNTEEQRLATLSGCFAAQIQETMQLSGTSLRADVPLSDLGIDSLVAVDLRTWFFKELEVSVPVLSILNGESVKELCKVVLSQIQTVN